METLLNAEDFGLLTSKWIVHFKALECIENALLSPQQFRLETSTPLTANATYNGTAISPFWSGTSPTKPIGYGNRYTVQANSSHAGTLSIQHYRLATTDYWTIAKVAVAAGVPTRLTAIALPNKTIYQDKLRSVFVCGSTGQSSFRLYSWFWLEKLISGIGAPDGIRGPGFAQNRFL